MIKWIRKPSGYCPIQAEGYFIGYYFYFRSRWDEATIEFSLTKAGWENDLIHGSYLLKETKDPYAAGYLPYWKCRLLIWKGCLQFLFKQNKHKTI